MILVTGGAGFIGSNFILEWLAHEKSGVVNLDNLTYAGNPDNLSSISGDPRYVFVHGDGLNVRDWLYVTDHCAALRVVLQRGRIGETYHIGGNVEKTNIEVVNCCRCPD